MSSERKDAEVNLSMASLWPWSVFMPPEHTVGVAKRLGCDGLEIHPGISVVRKFEKLGKTGDIGLQGDSVNSAHAPFGRDETAVKKYELQNVDVLQTRTMALVSQAIWSTYPDKGLRHEAISGIAGYYGVPAIFHWPDDESRYQNATLEIHPHLKADEIDQWTKKGGKLALDISERKLGAYYERRKIPEHERKKVFSGFLQHAVEVHFQVNSADEWEQIHTGDIDGKLGNMIRNVKQQRPEIPIVVEVRGSLKTLFYSATAYAGTAPDYFKQIVEFVRRA